MLDTRVVFRYCLTTPVDDVPHIQDLEYPIPPTAIGMLSNVRPRKSANVRAHHPAGWMPDCNNGDRPHPLPLVPLGTHKIFGYVYWV